MSDLHVELYVCVYIQTEARSSNAICHIYQNSKLQERHLKHSKHGRQPLHQRHPFGGEGVYHHAILSLSNTDSCPKNAKGLHLLTMNTPNGQAVQVLLEELKDTYGTEWTTTLIDIFTNDQKKEWFLRLDPNGRLVCCVSLSQPVANITQAASLSWSTTPRALRSRSWRPRPNCFVS